MNEYDDIINLPYPYKSSHKKMTRLSRAAQFAPFSALNGYEESIQKASKILEERKILDESQKQEINEKLVWISSHIKENIEVEITYFQKEKEDKGSVETIISTIKKIENHIVILKDKRKISFEDIYEILIK